LKYYIYILLFILLSSQNVFSQENKITDGIKSITLKFYVTHPWKKVTGVCNEPKIESLKITGNKDFPTISSPFLVKCNLLNMKTGDANRDSHLMEVLGYPESKEIIFSVTSTQADKDMNYKISGDLTIKGNSKPIVFYVKLNKETSLVVSGNFDILLSDFLVERPALLFVPINDKVKIEVSIVI
jgi:hypothetical protein